MARPTMGRSARTVPVTIKVSENEAHALSSAHGTPHKALRHLVDQFVGSGAVQKAPERPSGRCRIHKNWSEPTETVSNGTKTVSKTCLDCGFTSRTNKPA